MIYQQPEFSNPLQAYAMALQEENRKYQEYLAKKAAVCLLWASSTKFRTSSPAQGRQGEGFLTDGRVCFKMTQNDLLPSWTDPHGL